MFHDPNTIVSYLNYFISCLNYDGTFLMDLLPPCSPPSTSFPHHRVIIPRCKSIVQTQKHHTRRNLPHLTPHTHLFPLLLRIKPRPLTWLHRPAAIWPRPPLQPSLPHSSWLGTQAALLFSRSCEGARPRVLCEVLGAHLFILKAPSSCHTNILKCTHLPQSISFGAKIF